MTKPAIAVDAMTAEKGIETVVRGAERARNLYGIPVILVGNRNEIQRYLTKIVHVEHCKEVITNEDAERALVEKKNSSQSIGVQLVKEGVAAAFVSAGNSAATGYFAKKYLRINNIKKTPIVQRIPAENNGYALVGDLGFYLEYDGKELFTAGLMMSIYAEHAFNIEEPRVALLTIGSEKSKGSKDVQEAYDLFSYLLKDSNIRFVGNMEPGDIFEGNADCFICNGEVGNIFLKTTESTASFVKREIKREFLKPTNFIMSLPGLGGILSTYSDVYKRFNRSNYGGALMLGVNGVVVITHSSSDAKAICESIRVAYDAAEKDIAGIIQQELPKYEHLLT